MAPSTVFSYWRRDHRRATSLQPNLKPNNSSNNNVAADSPPQLPVIPNTPTLSSSIGNSPTIPSEYSAETSDFDVARLNAGGTTPDGQSPASANLRVPSRSSDRQSHPQSSPVTRENPGETWSTPYADPSPVSSTAARPDHGGSESSSPHPFTSGKGQLVTESQSPNTQGRSGASGMASGGHFRFRSSPDESPADKPGPSQQDYNYKYDAANNNPVRSTEREVPIENSPHKSGKARLHLLNPMLLLAKRRSSRAPGSKAGDGKKLGPRNNLIPAIPEDYDPRIRGNIVHDFSAPRPPRNLSGQTDEMGRSSAHARSQSGFVTLGDRGDRASEPVEQHGHSEHSPAFREHFDDDAQKSLQAENKAMQSRLLQTQDHGRELPEFAKRLPSRVDHDDGSQHRSGRPPAQQEGRAEGQNQGADRTEKPQPSTGQPRRLKSNSSRFSFDMNAVESSVQEKLLEEKHKEKEATRRAKAQFEDRDFSDVDDDYDDVLDDDDGLEEQIPGVNVDADADELDPGPGLADKSWLAPGLSPVVASPISPAGPTVPIVTASDANNDRGLDPGIHGEPSLDPSHSPSVYDDSPPGDEMHTQQQANQSIPAVNTHGAGPATSQKMHSLEDDELYFDDGEFGDLDAEAEGETFDESIFDNETSHLFDRKTKGEPQREQGTGDIPFESDEPTEQPVDKGLKHVPSMASEFLSIPGDQRHSSERIPTMGTIKSHGGVLTEHNLEALHNALAKAADEASTKVDRNSSLSERSTDQGSVARTVDSHPGLVSDDSRLSQVMDTWAVDEAFEDFSHEDNDATYYDDPIIAAANAEALENDDEGFYGQEFGFYAYAHGNSGSQLTNGGYFGPRGIEGITRSHSSRAKFEEPSLTPITERSEWSTRNSVISLSAAHGAAHSNANTSLSSPGLAQLVDMGNIDDEMSLSALLKLRRDAFGGSNGSLQSSSGSPPLHAAYPASKRGSQAGLSDVSPISPTGLDANSTEWPTSPDGIDTEDASRLDV